MIAVKRGLRALLFLLVAALLCAPALAAEETAGFVPLRTYEGQFADVADDAWYRESVALCYEYGLMEGAGGRFLPDGELTVAQALVMADRVHALYTAGEDALTNGSPWYQPYVDYALAQGILLEGEFADYNAPITRAGMAGLFARALPAEGYAPINDASVYPPDVTAETPWAAEIMTLYGAGIVTGGDVYGTFRPGDPIARREAAAVLARVALPEQRQHFTMMRDWDYDGAVRLTVPAAGVLVPQELEGVEAQQVMYGTLAAGCTRQPLETAAGDYSILAIPTETLEELMRSTLAQTGLIENVAVTPVTVAFGDLPAYRMDYTMDAMGLRFRGHDYMFLLDGAMYEVNFMGYYAGEEMPAATAADLRQMVNRLTVLGSGPSEKLK